MKKYSAFVFCIFLIFMPELIFAQVRGEEKPTEPATKLEAFLVKKGKIVIKDSYELGAIMGRFGRAEVDALVIYEPGIESERIRGLRVEIKEAGRLERSHTSFLDMEEIESLSKAIKYMADLSEKWKGEMREAYTEVTFSTKGHFKVGFYQKGSERSAYLHSGYIGRATCFMEVGDFGKLKNIVDKGLSLLNRK